MSRARSSNIESSEWRSKCRQRLSEHIGKKPIIIFARPLEFRWGNRTNLYLETTLGFEIEPSRVRLNPAKDDPYAWATEPALQHLFQKNISDHSIGAYKQLCDGVGSKFRAILPAAKRISIDTIRINELEADKIKSNELKAEKLKSNDL